MDLNDLFEKNRYSVEDDKSVLIIGDTRKVKLTLEQINKLRRIKEAKKFFYDKDVINNFNLNK